MAKKFVVTGDQYTKIDGKLTEIKRQLRKKGGCPLDPERLSVALQQIIEGKFGGPSAVHIIDCDTEPFHPDGLSFMKAEDQLPNACCGQLVWDPTKVRLHLSKRQADTDCIEGNKLREKLEDRPVLKANVLDYLLSHPDLIPKKWMGEDVYFWGTIYRRREGSLCVRYLYWYDDRWHCRYSEFDDDWDSNDPAAILAS